jgi:hypothetical protein
MPVQRKVFRIEEGARLRAAHGVAAGDAEGALQHREFMTEMQSLRELIGPRAESMTRSSGAGADRGGAAYKHGLA